MKYRKDFVTNSSSTSYTCEITGESETFYDGCSYEEYGFDVCENGHTILNEYRVEVPLEEKFKCICDGRYNYIFEYIAKNRVDHDINYDVALMMLNGQQSEMTDEQKEIAIEIVLYELDGGNILACECPICRMDIITDGDKRQYLFTKTKIEDDEVLAYIKQTNKRRRVVRSEEYVEYVCRKMNVTVEDIEKEIRGKFSDYASFVKYIR